MPQPLTKLIDGNKDFTLNFSPDAMNMHPELAAMVSKSIAQWSIVEQELGYILIETIGSQAAPSLAMYSALTSSVSQTAAITAAANSILRDKKLSTFEAVMRVIKSGRKQRNNLAHHIWGYSPQLTDGLLLIDPQHLLDAGLRNKERRHLTIDEIKSMGFEEYIAGRRPNFSDIYVYRKPDLERIIRDFDQTSKIVFTFKLLVGDFSYTPSDDELYDTLSSYHLFAQYLRQ